MRRLEVSLLDRDPEDLFGGGTRLHGFMYPLGGVVELFLGRCEHYLAAVDLTSCGEFANCHTLASFEDVMYCRGPRCVDFRRQRERLLS